MYLLLRHPVPNHAGSFPHTTKKTTLDLYIEVRDSKYNVSKVNFIVIHDDYLYN